MRQALIENGVVTNIIAYDPDAEWPLPDGASLADIPDAEGNEPHIGWAFANDRFEQPISGPLMLVDTNLNDLKPPYVAADGTQYPRSIARNFSDADLAKLGWYRLNFDDRPEGLVKVEPGPREWRGDPQTAWQTWTATPIPATAEAVNAYRDRLVAGGAPVDIGGGKTLTLDLRNEQDFRNIQALYSRALTARVEGETSRQIRVRDAGDQEHLITVDQMIGLGKAIVDGIDAIYQASWAVKADIASGTLANAADIPAAFDAILRPTP